MNTKPRRLTAAASMTTLSAVAMSTLFSGGTALAAEPAHSQPIVSAPAALYLLPTLSPAAIPASPVIHDAKLAATARPAYHSVKSGDTMGAIARKYGLGLNSLLAHNGMKATSIIYPGQRIKLPGAKPAAAKYASAKAVAKKAAVKRAVAKTYTVKPGDTLGRIATRSGVPLSKVYSLNGLKSSSIIYPGQRIKLSGTAAKAAPAKKAAAKKPAAKKAPATSRIYTVKAGDSLGRISARHGVALSTVYALNGLNSRSVIYPGQKISLSGASYSAAAVKKVTKPVKKTVPPIKATPLPNPSTTQIKNLVRSTAKRMGVDPALALAFAEQESSFRQNVTSHAGAIGTMQVMPANQQWASDLAGRKLNLRNTQDNITAGIAIIRHLQRTSRSLDIAIASYYQGAYGVAKYGMYNETKVYVKQVKARVAKFR